MKTFIVKIQTTEDKNEAEVLEEVLGNSTLFGDILAYSFRDLEIPKLQEEE
jgi:hypothetical protein